MSDQKLADFHLALSQILKIWPDGAEMRRWIGSNEADLPMSPEEFIKIARKLRSVTERELHAKEQQRS